VRFPISERRVTNQKIGEKVCTLSIKGNTVTSVDPAGRQCPLYAREQYRAAVAPQRVVRRFLPSEEIAW
jgi:hypothetical protein